mmetsp:Transcript_48070/g.145174  ORF Transcript_48070/g.145174 Transcript_48070/m.145174 type:complete len:181 (+) Transcript_48070:190-732(+)
MIPYECHHGKHKHNLSMYIRSTRTKEFYRTKCSWRTSPCPVRLIRTLVSDDLLVLDISTSISSDPGGKVGRLPRFGGKGGGGGGGDGSGILSAADSSDFGMSTSAVASAVGVPSMISPIASSSRSTSRPSKSPPPPSSANISSRLTSSRALAASFWDMVDVAATQCCICFLSSSRQPIDC